jgi:hypothetical protein
MQEVLERLNEVNIELDELEGIENWEKVVRAMLERERQLLIQELNNG